MATLPQATVSVSAEAGSQAGGTGYCVVFGCTATSADSVPRLHGTWKSVFDQHGYSPALDYVALHIAATRMPIIFVALPIVTAGKYGGNDTSGITGTSVITTTGAPLEDCEAIVLVTTGGTLGVSGIVLSVSMDGGRTYKAVKLGVAMSYTVPYLGIVINFGAGNLVAGDVFRFNSYAPMWDSAGVAGVPVALAAQQKLARSWVCIGDIATAIQAGYVVTAINAYETTHKRFCLVRANIEDRVPLARKSRVATETLTFAEVGATGDTITRSAGSWLDDGFKIGDNFTITGSVSNNITTTNGIAAVTATVLTLGTDDLAAEVATLSKNVTMVRVATQSAYVAAEDTRFASIDAQKRIDLSIGRLWKLSPVTGWEFPRPVSWAASIREYQKDIHVTNWRVKDGPLDGWSMLDENGNVAQFDERVNSGGLAARFTCATTQVNGPNGAFIARSLTRDTEGSVLSQTHNMYVANVVCTVVQAATTMFLGQTPPLNDDGTMRASSRSKLESAVNTDLEGALLKEFVPGEGPRCSSVVWTMSSTDDLSGPGGTVNGVALLKVNGTIVSVNTVVKVS